MNKFMTRIIVTATAYLLLSVVDVAVAAGKYKIGDAGPGKGIVFYIEPAPRTRGFTYFEVSPTDIATGAKWCDNNNEAFGGIDWKTQPLGSGTSATLIMLQKCNESAAEIASNYTGGGLHDWTLPTVSEANLIRSALMSVGKGVPDSTIWTSSQFNSNMSWVTDLRTGAQNLDFKNHIWAVRAIRKFN